MWIELWAAFKYGQYFTAVNYGKFFTKIIHGQLFIIVNHIVKDRRHTYITYMSTNASFFILKYIHKQIHRRMDGKMIILMVISENSLPVMDYNTHPC
jgi:hypothetical protein